MDETNYRRITDTAKYFEAIFEADKSNAGAYVKTKKITAVQGKIGETVVTVLQNGHTETVNTVKADPVTGNPDWIATGCGGEKYIIKDSYLREKYTPSETEPDTFIPAGKPVRACRVSEDITFTAPWGADEYLIKGGYLVCNDRNEIYGVGEEEFRETYAKE